MPPVIPPTIIPLRAKPCPDFVSRAPLCFGVVEADTASPGTVALCSSPWAASKVRTHAVWRAGEGVYSYEELLFFSVFSPSFLPLNFDSLLIAFSFSLLASITSVVRQPSLFRPMTPANAGRCPGNSARFQPSWACVSAASTTTPRLSKRPLHPLHLHGLALRRS